MDAYGIDVSVTEFASCLTINEEGLKFRNMVPDAAKKRRLDTVVSREKNASDRLY